MQNTYSVFLEWLFEKFALKNYKDLQPGFQFSVRTFVHILKLCVQILKNSEDKAKRSLLMFVSISLICPISNGMFPSQSAPKVLLEPNKNFISNMELYNLHKIGRKSTKISLQNKTETLHIWNSNSKLALKNYIGVLQHGFPYCLGDFVIIFIKNWYHLPKKQKRLKWKSFRSSVFQKIKSSQPFFSPVSRKLCRNKIN